VVSNKTKLKEMRKMKISELTKEGWKQKKIIVNRSSLSHKNGEYKTDITKEELLDGTYDHVCDVRNGIDFLIEQLTHIKEVHDSSKFAHKDMFYNGFTNDLHNGEWSVFHQRAERHHLYNKKYTPQDVNLLDVLEYVVDGVMAGLSRRGEYREAKISNEVLQKAFNNTIKLLTDHIEVRD
jgi:hypothetical protein